MGDVITLKLSGGSVGFDEGTDMMLLTNSLQAVEKIIVSLYLCSNNKERMSSEDYGRLKLTLKNTRQGSWETDIVVFMSNVLLPLVPFAVGNASDIMMVVKNVYEFLKAKIQAEQSGKNVNYNFGSNNNVTIYNINADTVTIEGPEFLPDVSKKVAPYLRQLTSKINENELNNVKIGDGINNIELGTEDSTLFKTHSQWSEQVYEVTGKIIEAKATNFSGKMYIVNNQNNFDLPREINFESDNGLFDEELFKELFLKEKEFLCRIQRQFDVKENYNSKINKLRIVGFV